MLLVQTNMNVVIAFFIVLFIAQRLIYCCLTGTEVVAFEYKLLSFKGYGEANRLLERKHYFDLLKSRTIGGKIPRCSENASDIFLRNPSKIRDCGVCR